MHISLPWAWGPVFVLGLTVMALLRRRGELREYTRNHRAAITARERGSDKARLQHPDIDLSRCIGCGACIRACPEEGVLALMHGQAVVVHGARCVGHGLCAAACPTGGIALTLGDLSDRRDLPAVHDDLEAVGVPGLFIAGELSGFALVRTAVSHGVAVADAVAQRAASYPPVGKRMGSAAAPVPLLIVGSGPGGLACALRAKELGIEAVVLEQEPRIGGAVAAYPRRKLVMTQPMNLPLHGTLSRLSYQKEELIDLWEGIVAKQGVRIHTGVRMTAVQRNGQDTFAVHTTKGVVHARTVCLALGRRGTPRRLEVPGEAPPKVAYSLLDAESYRDRHVLVVGGGDSAVEAALGLAAQPGNTVTLSYRKQAFFRLKARNEARIEKAREHGRLRILFDSEVREIGRDRVRLQVGVNGSTRETILPNDEVFVFAGGIPPFPLLEQAGVSFDPADRPAAPAAVQSQTGLLAVFILLLTSAAGMCAWAVWHRAYYGAMPAARAALPAHALLRPTGPVGLCAGLAACALFVWNLTYLVRRSARWGRWLPGSLRRWMNAHVFTGLFAFLCVLLHAGFALRDSVGGHAFLAFAVVVVSGVIGRYMYAFVPRAANGTEMTLHDLRTHMATLSGEWDRHGRGFGTTVRQHVDELLLAGRWRPSLVMRLWAIAWGQVRLWREAVRLRAEGKRLGIPDAEVRRMLALARRAYRLTLLVTHYEEVRAVLASWRYFHRWLALLLVLLAAIHIATAARYAHLDWSVLPGAGGGPP